ncbi:MAG: 30S ribosomal protein S1 [Chitinophagales bacterium]
MTENENLEQENVQNTDSDVTSPEVETTEVETNETETNEVETNEVTETTKPVAFDDFDWDADKRNRVSYPKEKAEELEKIYEATFRTLNNDEIVLATIVGITDSDVVMNVGYKSDGLIPKTEFRDIEDLKIGQEYDVYVVSKEDLKGHLVLSRKNAKMMKAWDKIVDAYKNEVIVTGNIVSKTKGGLIVEVFGLETFLPGSQIDVKPITDYDIYVGKKMEFKVVKINEAIKNAVVSHKALIESDIESQRQEIIGKLEKGQVLEGLIKNITDFGAFIDLGGVDGLLYITDISWGRITHPNEVLQLNQKLNVVVLDFDDNKKRISLGLKQLTPHPWDVLEETIQVGSTVNGKIVNIEDYGAFLEVQPGVEGLVHVSEISWSNQPINSKDFFKMNDSYEAKVVTLDREERKMSLSLKQLTEDPWSKVEEKYPVGSRHTGVVKNLTPYGVFVELDENSGGMVHISDLSWTKRFQHPGDFTKVGESLDVIIMDIDKENRKMSLGHKQVEEDPWDTFETVFPEGSVHEATIIRKDDKGAIVSLPYGVEGYAPNRHLEKEDGTSAQIEETLSFRVIEFDRNDKRILVSHTRFHQDKNNEEQKEKKETMRKEEKKTKTVMKGVQKNIEKTTLGELDVLNQLRDRMEADLSAPKAKKVTKEELPAVKEVKEPIKTEDAPALNTEETIAKEEAPAEKKKKAVAKKEEPAIENEDAVAENEEPKEDSTEETEGEDKA